MRVREGVSVCDGVCVCVCVGVSEHVLLRNRKSEEKEHRNEC